MSLASQKKFNLGTCGLLSRTALVFYFGSLTPIDAHSVGIEKPTTNYGVVLGVVFAIGYFLLHCVTMAGAADTHEAGNQEMPNEDEGLEFELDMDTEIEEPVAHVQWIK